MVAKGIDVNISIKILPNVISVSRIVFSVVLLFLEPLSALFYVVYVYCILSDMIDGTIARLLKAESKQGPLLDSIGDFAFVIAIIITIFRCFTMPVWLIVWIAAIFVVKVASAIISIKRHSGVIAHTFLDKVCGYFVVLIIPVAHVFDIGVGIPGAVACVITSITAIEDTAIAFSKRKVTSDTLSFFKL